MDTDEETAAELTRRTPPHGGGTAITSDEMEEALERELPVRYLIAGPGRCPVTSGMTQARRSPR